jgi:hypothetical protein
VTSEESRVAFTEQLTAAEDWLYGDGEMEGAEAFKSKLKELQAVGDPMARRAAELELRPQVRGRGRDNSWTGRAAGGGGAAEGMQ